TPRQLLLFAVACCQPLRAKITDRPTLQLLEAAERFADGRESREAFDEALAAALPYPGPGRADYARWRLSGQMRRAQGALAVAELIAATAGRPPGRLAALVPALWEVQNRVARAAEGPRTFLSFEHARLKEKARQAGLLRCLAGNPFG